jgi:hypothetical protein
VPPSYLVGLWLHFGAQTASPVTRPLLPLTNTTKRCTCWHTWMGMNVILHETLRLAVYLPRLLALTCPAAVADFTLPRAQMLVVVRR